MTRVNNKLLFRHNSRELDCSLSTKSKHPCHKVRFRYALVSNGRAGHLNFAAFPIREFARRPIGLWRSIGAHHFPGPNLPRPLWGLHRMDARERRATFPGMPPGVSRKRQPICQGLWVLYQHSVFGPSGPPSGLHPRRFPMITSASRSVYR